MTNCQYANYILLIQEHKKSHLVEKKFKIKQSILEEECFHIIQAQENVIKRNTRTVGFHLKGVGIFTAYVRGVNLQIWSYVESSGLCVKEENNNKRNNDIQIQRPYLNSK